MSEDLRLRIELLSAAMPGRGDGVAGLVDFEVEHDNTGLPFIKSRTVKGLLVEECANILYALKLQNTPDESKWHDAAEFLFGKPGAFLVGAASVRFGSAKLHHELREAVRYAQSIASKNSSTKSIRIDKACVLEATTAIRRRSSIETESGRPEDGSLRSARLVLRGLTFYAPVYFESAPSTMSLALLAATTRALQRLGSSRNRGLGKCDCRLLDTNHGDAGTAHLIEFARLIGERKQ